MDKKRICLFAAYDKDAIIDEYVVYYIKELAKFADVYYYADSDMSAQELGKLDGIVKYAKAQRHGKYDFGSWSEIIKDIGWSEIEKYDSVLFVNDSCYGPMYPLEKLFETMDSKDIDAWSVCGNKFMMSFFVSINQKAMSNDKVRFFFDNITPEASKDIVIKKYESGLSNVLTENGFNFDYYISAQSLKKYYKKNHHQINNDIKSVAPFWVRLFINFGPNKVRLYDDDFILPFFMGMPIIKKMSLVIPYNIVPFYYQELISLHSDYPTKMIENHFARMGNVLRRPIKDIIKARIKDKLMRFVSDRKFRGNKYIVRVFTIPVYWKKMDYTINESDD